MQTKPLTPSEQIESLTYWRTTQPQRLLCVLRRMIPRPNMARLKLAALGSSFAAGPSIDPIINTSAMRSGRNYAHQLALEVGADLTDLTVSGATLLNVLNEPQTPSQGDIFPPQLEGLPPDTDIVTLTGGGNDLGYSFGMIHDSLVSYVGPLRGLVERWIAHPATDLDLEGLTDRFITLIDAIHSKAPQARIFLVQYLSVFGSSSKPGLDLPLTWEQIGNYRRRAILLDQAYEKAAAARPGIAELVNMADLSEGHEVGTSEPWMTGLSLGILWKGKTPYHPNLAGHTAVAQELCRIIEARKRKQAESS